MHPQVHTDRPGDCPVCGMKLIKKSTGHAADTASADTVLSYLTEPVTQTVTGAFKTMAPVWRDVNDTIPAEGVLAFDPRDIHTLASRVTGRIERLYVHYSRQRIEEGQPLMDIYSPQLLQAQRELLQAAGEKNGVLVAALSEKLHNLGMDSRDIRRVLDDGRPLLRVTIASPWRGIVVPAKGSDPEAGGRGSLGVSTGLYVQAGQTLLAVQGIRRYWAMLHVLGQDMPHLRRGVPVQLYAEAFPAKRITGQVDFISPYREGQDKAMVIRVYLDKVPDGWKDGTLIHGTIIGAPHSGMYVPLSAVYRLGTRSVVWVKDKTRPHVFHVRLVDTGARGADSVEIRSGIDPEDQIVENAAYLVDSESFIL